VADGKLSDARIAARVGVSTRTLERWRAEPPFGERVAAYVRAAEAQAREHAIARKSHRLAVLNELVQGLLQVRDERAADPQMAAVAGGRSGLLVRTLKMIGAGERAQVVEEHTLDGTLLREAREYLEAAARELGEWDGRGAEAEEAPVVALQQIVVQSREDARTYLERVELLGGRPVVLAPAEKPTAPPLPPSLREAVADVPDAAADYAGPDGL
jgi:hypothetical protein